MIEADMFEAKTKLCQLVEAAERGEEVFLKQNGVLVAQILPVRKREFRFGFLNDEARMIEEYLLFNSEEDELEECTRP